MKTCHNCNNYVICVIYPEMLALQKLIKQVLCDDYGSITAALDKLGKNCPYYTEPVETELHRAEMG